MYARMRLKGDFEEIVDQGKNEIGVEEQWPYVTNNSLHHRLRYVTYTYIYIYT